MTLGVKLDLRDTMDEYYFRKAKQLLCMRLFNMIEAEKHALHTYITFTRIHTHLQGTVRL